MAIKGLDIMDDQIPTFNKLEDELQDVVSRMLDDDDPEAAVKNCGDSF